ncbi:3'-5' exonuclease [Marinobacter maritimus]|uniref:3'-5' exonuclease n=1 Tax=Marinobacter maritimus TaxID=277961 RepID=UPI0011A05341|nr:3'-5' exonuclease [Marinobacter maritimus]
MHFGSLRRQYLNEEELDETLWRPTVVLVIKELRFVLDEHVNAKGWHKHAKSVMERHVSIPEGESISVLLKWNKDLESVLKPFEMNQLRPRTIHSVKGEEFSAVCVVTTAQTVKGVLDFLEKGEPVNRAEDARKLYVGASRAKRLLVLATPKSQANRLASQIGMLGARTNMIEIESD